MGVYKKTINPLTVKNGISFSMNINGGQGELRLELDERIINNEYNFSDIVVVTVFDKNNNGTQIYRWHITRINRIIDQKWEGISLVCLWWISILNRIFFRSGSSLVFNKNQDPAQTIKDAIDNINLYYDYFSYDKIIDYSNSISINFDYKKTGEALNDIVKTTSWRYYYVDSLWDVTYRAKNDILVNHRVKLDNEVDYFQSEEEIEWLANNVFVRKNIVIWPLSDATSISEYGHIDYIFSTNADGTPSVTLAGNNYLTENKNMKKEIRLTINNRYNIESIQPWHHITLLNADYTIQPLQVMKVNYKYDKVDLELERYTTFSDTILSQS